MTSASGCSWRLFAKVKPLKAHDYAMLKNSPTVIFIWLHIYFKPPKAFQKPKAKVNRMHCWAFAAQHNSLLCSITSTQFMINKNAMPYLFRRLRFNINRINAFGFGQQLGLTINGLVFFTGQPELNVFLTELCPEELREAFHPIWWRETKTMLFTINTIQRRITVHHKIDIVSTFG